MITKLDNIVVLVFFILVGLVILFGAIWIFNTEKRLKRFFLGKKGKDLEDTIAELQNELAKLSDKSASTLKEVADIKTKLKKSIRGVEVLRFNPFPDQGSNQSFAIAMLDEEGDGLVLSSLYSRERMSVFAKPILGGASTYELSSEEKESLKRAKV